MKKTTLLDQPLAALRCATDPGESDSLKTVRIAPAGLVESRSGNFIIDSEAGSLIVKDFVERGNEVVVDFEHSSLRSAVGPKDAAGWVKEVWYDPKLGLMGRVQWNADARERIRSKRYQYLSPVVMIRTADRKAVSLDSVGLTNRPAISGMDKLVASTDASNLENATMDVEALVEEIRKMLSLEEGADVAATLTAVRDNIKERLEKAKAKADATPEDAKVAQSVRSRLELAEDASSSEVILAMSTAEQNGSGSKELAGMRKAEADRVATAHVDRFVQENRINPKDTQAMDAALELAHTAPDKLDALMANAAPIHPVGKSKAPTGRIQLVLSAAREFRADDKLQATTSLKAFINLQLHDAGAELLSDTEVRELP